MAGNDVFLSSLLMDGHDGGDDGSVSSWGGQSVLSDRADLFSLLSDLHKAPADIHGGAKEPPNTSEAVESLTVPSASGARSDQSIVFTGC